MPPTAKVFFVLAVSVCAHADDVFFGVPVSDPYRGLEISTAAPTQAWLMSENQLTTAYFAALAPSQQWRTALAAATSSSTVSMPKVVTEAPTLINGEELGLAHPPDQWNPSPDGRYVAYSFSPQHHDAGELHVRHRHTNMESPADVLPWETYADLAWSADSRGFYYLAISSGLNDVDRVSQAAIRYHELGHSRESDREVFPATHNASHYLTPQTSVDGRWLFVSIADGFSGNTLYARDLSQPSTSFQLIFASTSSTASVTSWKERFYLFTNDHAPQYAVWMSSGPRAPWQTLIPQPREGHWESLQIYGGHLVLQKIRRAASELVICTLAGRDCHAITLPALGSVETLEGHPQREDFYFHFESFFIPPVIYKASVQTGRIAPWKSKAANQSSPASTVRQSRYISKDGTPISLWLLYQGRLNRHRPRPTILTGYGGFAVSMTPRYQAAINAWVKAGGFYAVPMLRGGGEEGEAWHAAGMRLEKQHTFDDMIAAAEFLVKEGYTCPDRLAIQGGSNGGLTVAAVITQRPDLFRAAILKNPLTDMIRYPLFGEGPAWISEYGSPSVEADFRALIAYSPYHRVVQGTRYPAVLILSADADDRVDPMHARKFAAALQAASASGHPVLFKTLPKTGHAGADSPEADLNEWTGRLSFLQHELNF